MTELASKTGCRFRFIPDPEDTTDWINMIATRTIEYYGETTTLTQREPTFPPGWRDSDMASTISISFDGDGLPLPTHSTETHRPIDPSATHSGLRVAAPIYLVHGGNGNNNSSGGGGNGTGNGNGDGTEEDGEEDTGDAPQSAARGLAPNGWVAAGAIMAAWGISMAAGVGLLASW